MRLLNGQKCSYLVPFFLSFFPFFFFFARHVASLFFFFFSFLFLFSFFSWKSGRCFFIIIINFLISWGCGYGWACYQFFFSFFLFFSFLDLAFFPPCVIVVLFCFFFFLFLIRHDFFWNMIFIF